MRIELCVQSLAHLSPILKSNSSADYTCHPEECVNQRNPKSVKFHNCDQFQAKNTSVASSFGDVDLKGG